MPSKLLLRNFESGAYYHLIHAGKVGNELFKTDADYKTFLLLLSYYLRFPDATPLSWVKRLNPKTVVSKRDSSEFGASPASLHGFLLLPDQFHLVLRENKGGTKPGISNLMRHVSVAYAMYYNKTYQEKGTIYHGKYKQKMVSQNELTGLIDDIHHFKEINDTFLSSPLHSSRPDYTNNPRPWITLIPQTEK